MRLTLTLLALSLAGCSHQNVAEERIHRRILINEIHERSLRHQQFEKLATPSAERDKLDVEDQRKMLDAELSLFEMDVRGQGQEVASK